MRERGKKAQKIPVFSAFGRILKKIAKIVKKLLTNRKLFDIMVKHLRGLNSECRLPDAESNLRLYLMRV